MPRSVHLRETVELSGDALRLIVVADTHSAPHPKSAELIAAQKPDRILHAGDIGDLVVLEGLKKLAPLSAIRGNIDTHAPDLPDDITLDIRDAKGPLLALLIHHIAVYGPKLRGEVAKLAKAEGAQLVVCGHSHVPFMGQDKGLYIFNPGSIGPRRFQLPIVFGVIDVARTGIKMFHVDCETGQRWSP
jgi:putative phosphoesterase